MAYNSYEQAKAHYFKMAKEVQDARAQQRRLDQVRYQRALDRQQAQADFEASKAAFQDAAGTDKEAKAFAAVQAAGKRVQEAENVAQLLKDEDGINRDDQAAKSAQAALFRMEEAQQIALNEFSRRIAFKELAALPTEAKEILGRAFACWSVGFNLGGWPTFLSSVAFPNPPSDIGHLRRQALLDHGVVE